MPNPEVTHFHSRYFAGLINWLSAVKTGPFDFDPVCAYNVKPNTTQTDPSRISGRIVFVWDFNSSSSRHHYTTGVAIAERRGGIHSPPRGGECGFQFEVRVTRSGCRINFCTRQFTISAT